MSATSPSTLTLVPPDHLVRQIHGVLDLSWVHTELAPYYSHTGRPSIDPVLMIQMLIVGYVFAIRSERQLCAEVQVNFAYRWFCGLGIEDNIPDHSVFCRARHERFRESDALRRGPLWDLRPSIARLSPATVTGFDLDLDFDWDFDFDLDLDLAISPLLVLVAPGSACPSCCHGTPRLGKEPAI
jgi:hypothetical protein